MIRIALGWGWIPTSVAVSLVLAALNTPALAEEAAPERRFVSDDNVGDKVREVRKERAARFDLGFRDLMLRFDEDFHRRTGIRFTVAYTVVYQHASRGDGPKDAAGGDVDLVGRWEAVGRKGGNLGLLAAAFEGRHRIESAIAPSGLSTTIDSLWPTVSGFNRQDFALTQLYWQQDLFRERLRLIFGKLSGYSTFFGNRINSSNTFFLNYAYSDNPAVFFPGNGLGLHAIYKFSDPWSMAVGIQNANGKKTEIDPSTLEEGEFWYAWQLQLSQKVRGLGVGTYRIGGWFSDERKKAETPAGAGGVLSIDQELGEHVIGFLRWEYQGAGLVTPQAQVQSLTGTEHCLRLGAAILGPIPALPDDYLGIGAAWGKPSQTAAKDSFAAEIFYRSQMTDFSQLSASLQYVQSSTIYDEVLVFGLRFRIEV